MLETDDMIDLVRPVRMFCVQKAVFAAVSCTRRHSVAKIIGDVRTQLRAFGGLWLLRESANVQAENSHQVPLARRMR